jgi:hypothetical protein
MPLHRRPQYGLPLAASFLVASNGSPHVLHRSVSVFGDGTRFAPPINSFGVHSNITTFAANKGVTD